MFRSMGEEEELGGGCGGGSATRDIVACLKLHEQCRTEEVTEMKCEMECEMSVK
jgi:hypothetical protein